MTIQEQLLELLPEKKEHTHLCAFLMSQESDYNCQCEAEQFNLAINLMSENIKTLRVDEEKLYKFLKSIKACNIENKDTDWCEIVNVRDLAKAICSSNILTGGEK